MKFDYGDTVTYRATDAEGNVVEKPCDVVAITLIENDKQAEHFGHRIGTVVYTVEFGDGTDAHVAERDLRLP